ncbi:hypothetical protein U9M48_039710 [Paspalum notatum var. saurae]|uniref:Uncharacterized protein n=1 Tax=Paspalum notatum var. saurae TaxID=547442 RepID=A0AAQ3UJH4_PASNO
MQSAAAFRPCSGRPLVSRKPSRLILSARPLHISVAAAAAAGTARYGALGARGLGLGLVPISPDRESKARQRQVACDATGDAAAEEEEGGGLVKTLQLGALFGLWYLFNIYFNIYNKQVSGADSVP